MLARPSRPYSLRYPRTHPRVRRIHPRIYGHTHHPRRRTVPIRYRSPNSIKRRHVRSLSDEVWRLTWPYVLTSVLAALIIIFAIVIGVLEIVSLAKGTNTQLFGKTASTGAGLWCGLIILLAGLSTIALNFLRQIQLFSLISLFANILGCCAAIILIGLDAKAVDDGKLFTINLTDKAAVLAAQLSFSLLEFFLCLTQIIIFILTFFVVRARISRLGRRRIV